MEIPNPIAGNPRPYLSVVAPARNDDHGGDFSARMQAFVNALIGQAKRHHLSVELILVEWNPPPQRPKLAEALRWPADFGPSTVRIIEVPPEIHARYKHSKGLALYQMIAKNVGIRRARGEFVLATNIDILFSDELFDYMRRGNLQRGKLYRIDRHDVTADVPVDASVDEQLAFCRSHLIRVHARLGTFPLTPDGRLVPAPAEVASASADVASERSEVTFGQGWFEPEQDSERVFRWMSDEAEVVVSPAGAEARTLVFDIEAGPAAGGGPVRFQVLTETGDRLIDGEVLRRATLRLQRTLAAGQTCVYHFRAAGHGLRAPNDPRILNLRVVGWGWQRQKASAPDALGGLPKAGLAEQGAGWLKNTLRLAALVWRLFRRVVKFLLELRRATSPVSISISIFPRFLEKLRLRMEDRVLTLTVDPAGLKTEPARPAEPAAIVELPQIGPNKKGPLHTYASGDFTMMALENWTDLRGYPEFDLFALHLDSVLCYTAHFGGIREEVLPDPMRIYHIEHEIGSGYTPEGKEKFIQRLEDRGVAWLDYPQLVALADQMRRLDSPMIFNRENWGLAEFDLPETIVTPAS